eukprot:211524_1
MAATLSMQRLFRFNAKLYSRSTQSICVIHQKRQMFEWTKLHITDPIYGVTQHIYNDPLNFTVGLATVCIFSYGLREYVSRKVIYVPFKEFTPTWKTELQSVEYKEITFKNIINNNIDLHGLYIKGNNKKLSNYPLLFLHGNAGNISHRIDNLLLLHDRIGCDIFIFDYRGYGKSTNKQPTQNGLIEDTISAMNELKIITNNENIKPIIFGRSLGGAVAIHSIKPLIKQYEMNIGGVIIENSFTSCWDCVGNNFLYPLIADKWNNIECIDQLKQENVIDIPILFISAINDTMLDPQMMKNLHKYAIENGHFSNVFSKEFPDGDHNDTFLCRGYSETINNFIQFVEKQ